MSALVPVTFIPAPDPSVMVQIAQAPARSRVGEIEGTKPYCPPAQCPPSQSTEKSRRTESETVHRVEVDASVDQHDDGWSKAGRGVGAVFSGFKWFLMKFFGGLLWGLGEFAHQMSRALKAVGSWLWRT